MTFDLSYSFTFSYVDLKVNESKMRCFENGSTVLFSDHWGKKYIPASKLGLAEYKSTDNASLLGKLFYLLLLLLCCRFLVFIVLYIFVPSYLQDYYYSRFNVYCLE